VTTSTARLGHLVAALLVLGVALFVLGSGLERRDHHDEPAATTTAQSGEQTGHDEATEAAEGHGESSTQTAVEGSEKVLGLDVESPALVALGVGVSLVLAALAWLRPHRAVFVVIAVFAATFAVLDVAEMLHQIDKSRTGLAVLASVLALVHLLTALASAAGVASAASDTRPIAPLGLA
jgi:Flp pilus assembly protein TadB